MIQAAATTQILGHGPFSARVMLKDDSQYVYITSFGDS
jgi:hypothetical protein